MPTVYNKVTAGGSTLIDLSQDTVTSASDIVSGKVGHLADGTQVTGTGGSSSPTLQSKTATPSESQQTVTPDSGYDGLSSVTVGAVSSTYVGTGVARKSSSDLTASGLTVTAPVGYYASDATKTLSDANLVAGNIKKDVSIFGVTGTYEGGGSSGASYKKGTYTPSTTHKTAENVEITTLATIGFTPKKMCFYVTNSSNLSGKSSVLLYTICDIEHSTRFTMRYSNSSGTTAATGATTNWIMQAGGYLYCDGTKVYIRTSSSYGIISNVEYTWEAFG